MWLGKLLQTDITLQIHYWSGLRLKLILKSDRYMYNDECHLDNPKKVLFYI